MERKPTQQKTEDSKSSANELYEQNQMLQTHWPPPLQLDENQNDRKSISPIPNDKSHSQSPTPPYSSEEKSILHSNITIQQKPPELFKQIGAKAFTQGKNIYVKENLNLEDAEDQLVFAHEISHALTNHSGTPDATTSRDGIPINDDINLEQKADEGASKILKHIDKKSLQNILRAKSNQADPSNVPIQRKESEDEKKIRAEQEKIHLINKEQNEFLKSQGESYLPVGFSSSEYNPNSSYENRKSYRYDALIPLLKKDIVFLAKLNVRLSEKVAMEAAKSHLTGNKEAIVDEAYKGYRHIAHGRTQTKKESPSRGGRLGSLNMTPSDLGKKEIKKGEGMLESAKAQDALVFIAANVGKADLLQRLTSGHSAQDKKAAITEIMEIFHSYSSRTMQYVNESPFEFKPIIKQLSEGRKGVTGFDWSSDPEMFNRIVAQAEWNDTLSSLGPDIAALVLAIASAFFTGGFSASLILSGAAIEGATVAKSYNEMIGADASSKSHANKENEVYEKALAEGKALEFFVTAAGTFLGATVDGVELAGFSKKMLKRLYNKIGDKRSSVKLTEISAEDYLAKFTNGDSEKAFIGRRKKYQDQVDKAKKSKAPKEEVDAIKMSDSDEKLNRELREVLLNKKGEFRKRMPAAIRNAGGWKNLIDQVGDDPFIRAGMEQWRSDLFAEMDKMITKKYGKPLVRTGSQAKGEAGIVELMKGSKSDLDISIPFNKVAEARSMLRNHLCDVFECSPAKLDDYLDMSIFANTPVKAVINTVKNPASRDLLLEEQSRFEMVTIYNMLLKKAKKMGRSDTVKMLEDQMHRLEIPKEDFKKYQSLADQDQLQMVIDNSMLKVEKLEDQINQNQLKIESLLKQEHPKQRQISNLKKKNDLLEKEVESAKMQAMKGTTFLDISETESFWSHAGIMEVVFKQNDDFAYLIDNAYTPAQKQIMVVHDMAQLETKLMKMETRGETFNGIQNIDSKLLKDTCKSSSRLANALSINSADDQIKTRFLEISERLIKYKNELSGPVSAEKIQLFKKNLQDDLIVIDQLCKKQINSMGDSQITRRFSNQKMIGKYEGEIKRAMLLQQTRQMLSRVLKNSDKIILKSLRTVSSQINGPQDNKSTINSDSRQKVSAAYSSIESGHSSQAIEHLASILSDIQIESENTKQPKWDLIKRNLIRDFTYLKKKSNIQGGIFDPDDLKRADFVRRNLQKINHHLSLSPLSEKDKLLSLKTTSQLVSNLDQIVIPSQDTNKMEQKRGSDKRIIEPKLKLEKEYQTAEDRSNYEKEIEKPILKKHNHSVPLSMRSKNGKYVKILKGDEYFVNGKNEFLGKKDSK